MTFFSTTTFTDWVRALRTRLSRAAARWRQAAAPRAAADDADHALWLWLSSKPADAPTLHLGYGREDRFSEGHRLLAQTLPPAQVQVVAGGHDWPAWRVLWSNWLDRRLLPGTCTA